MKRLVYLCSLVSAVAACASSDHATVIVGSECDGGACPTEAGSQPPPPPPQFTPDSGPSPEAAPPPMRGPQVCPSDKCAPPRATCPSSKFACDADLSTDPNNCGSCGFVCQSLGTTSFTCQNGKCIMACNPGFADCDGIIDNGCETTLGTTTNCSACGNVCTNQSDICKPLGGGGYKCSPPCDPPLTFCSRECVDTTSDDFNCGHCGNRCPQTSDAGTPPPQMSYGCGNSQCGDLKCQPHWADCNNDLSDGCETQLEDPSGRQNNDNCGKCGVKCAAGTTCGYDRTVTPPVGPLCLCAPGKTACDSTALGEPLCYDPNNDPLNCGSCGVVCPPGDHLASFANGTPICSSGSCSFQCTTGYGDCNGDPWDGCEVNLNDDPHNCGTCGNACNGIAGQPCIAGQCATVPCGGPQ